jgi:hypothetical protein
MHSFAITKRYVFFNHPYYLLPSVFQSL